MLIAALSKKIGPAPSRESAPSPLVGPATLQTWGEKEQRPCHAAGDGADGAKLPSHQVREGSCGGRAYIAGCSRTALEPLRMITLRSARLWGAPSVDGTEMRNFSPEAAKSGGSYLMAPAVRPET